MWIKFAEGLINFELAAEMSVVTDDLGATVRVLMDNGGILSETFSTPRAAQDRFDALAGVLTGAKSYKGMEQ